MAAIGGAPGGNIQASGYGKKYSINQYNAPQPIVATQPVGRFGGLDLNSQFRPQATQQMGGVAPTPTPTPTQSGPTPEEQAIIDRENQIRGEINTGFDAYFSQLDQQLGGIPTQQQGQNQIVENNYNQGLSDINAQKTSSLGDLNTQRRKTGEQQVTSLRDIADNIKNLFQAGNVMLGTRGAGDSSAANQYSYAVTKLGSKQRGNVLNQTRSIENDIADRESKLNNIVTQETSKLRTDRDNQILQIAQYFQDVQNQLQQAKAQGQLQKGQSLASLSTQLLQNAQQKLMQIDANFQNQQNALMTWAMNNSQNINQLKSNLGQLGGYQAPNVGVQPINGQMQMQGGNLNTIFGGGGGYGSEENDLFPRRM